MSYKIAIISSSTPPKVTGGISSANWNLYLALKRAGFNVKVFTYNDNGYRGYQDGDVVRNGAPAIWLRLNWILDKFYRIMLKLFEGQVDYAYQLFYVLNSMIGALRINRSLKTFQPDVVIYPDNGSPGYFISLPAGCKKIFISHHNYLRFVNEPFIGRFSEIDAKLAMYFEHKTVSRVDNVICPSSYMKDVFIATHQYQAPVEVIPNLVDQDFIWSIPTTDIHQLMNLHPDSPIVYIPSAGTIFKGSRFTFEIIRRLSSASRQIGFYLNGTMMDDILLKELTYIPDNVKVYCPGHTDYVNNLSMIKGCSFCVSPTIIESFGMAILEANFCGLPVVAFNAGGNADIINNGLNGFLVPFLDVEALVSASISLLDGKLNSEMRSKALLQVNKQFATEKIIERYIDVILNNKRNAHIPIRNSDQNIDAGMK